MADEIDVSGGIMTTRQAILTVMVATAGTLPEDRAAALSATLARPSPVDALVEAMEATYGIVKEMDPAPEAVIRLCGQAAFHVYSNAWHGKTDRAVAIFQACRRELGLTANAMTPDPETDPVAV
jgi:hypothetical protein